PARRDGGVDRGARSRGGVAAPGSARRRRRRRLRPRSLRAARGGGAARAVAHGARRRRVVDGGRGNRLDRAPAGRAELRARPRRLKSATVCYNRTGMRAMVLHAQREPLRLEEVPEPHAGSRQVLLRVRACGVCRTDLHVVDGELTRPKLPLVPGHQIVGVAEDGRRLGVPWLGWTCGECRFCRSGRENLCERARFTGYGLGGGYAEHAVADERFCFPLPEGYPDEQAAPLLCAGLIGYRALRLAEDAERLGLYGFGAAAHIVAQ